jgi:two-component sensor histidine kinase
MQSTYTQDARTMRVLRDCQDRVRSMALVHERLYQSGNLARVDFPAYVEDLSTQLFATYVLTPGTICLKLELETVWLDIDRAIPCGLILNELIANALKHAFPSGRLGEVRVCVRVQEPGGLMLSVVDNGAGLPDDATLQTRRSFGMDLIHALATQLDACIEFIHHDPGTEVRLILEEASHVHAS